MDATVTIAIDRGTNQSLSPSERPAHELDCACKVIGMLFDYTGLAAIVGCSPRVIVGGGNWISFNATQTVPLETILALRTADGASAFRADLVHPAHSVRSRTSPSLHLTNLDAGENLTGHVDAYYWARNPLGHADEFLTRKTAAPSELLRRLEEWLGPSSLEAAQTSSASWAMEKPGKV